MQIKIGTSGYSFEDWRGEFYPADVPKGKMLDYYQNHFDTVEINATYYRIPHPRIMANIAAKVKPHFEFVVKANQNLTHERRQIEEPAREFRESLQPLVERGQLKAVLAQFPWSFKFSAANLAYLGTCRELMAPYPLFVEFRHDSWMRRDTYDVMTAEGIGIVSVDGPTLKGPPPPELHVTTDTAYIRLHGRNAEHWWAGGPLRYDYFYSDAELQEWKEKLERLRGETKKAFIFFNNCHLGQAVKNARRMMKMLEL
jgi:uncharacterized protein YecE (DUF72 family)